MANIVKSMIDSVTRKTWLQRKSDIEAQITAARTKRAAAVNERHSLVVAAAEGNADARKRTEFLDETIREIDRELNRLGDALAQAAEHVAAEAQAVTTKREAERLKKVEAEIAEWREFATAVDHACDELAMRIGEFKEKSVSLQNRIRQSELAGHLADIYGKMPLLINSRLAFSGIPFKGGALPGADLQIATKLCDTGRLMALATQKG